MKEGSKAVLKGQKIIVQINHFMDILTEETPISLFRIKMGDFSKFYKPESVKGVT